MNKTNLFLQPLIAERPFLPYTSSALSADCISYLLNEIVINKRKCILEIGTGISTIMMSRLLEQNELPCIIMSVDNDKEWQDYIFSQCSRRENLGMVHAGLDEEFYADGKKYFWYDMAKIKERIRNFKFDLVFVDGPAAYLPGTHFCRQSAFPFLCKYLADDFCIMLDDCGRGAENKILAEWSELIGLPSEKFNDRLGVIRKGKYYNAEPYH